MNGNKLSKDDISNLYAFLIHYETELKNKAGLFDIENANLKSYLNKNQKEEK